MSSTHADNLPAIRTRESPFQLGRIFVAGHRGVVGSAIHQSLLAAGYEVVGKVRGELDLRDVSEVRAYLRRERIDTVVLAAAKVGGIQANVTDPVGFLLENLAIQGSVIPAAVDAHVSTLMFLGSSCIYPRNCPQPMSATTFMALLSRQTSPTQSRKSLESV